MSYADIYCEHNDYQSSKFDHYLFIYEELLEKYIQKDIPVNILEIGVRNGGSLQIWKKYLPEGSQIYGIDIDPNCEKLVFEDNIHFFLGDATSQEFWNNNLNNVTFDIILDDASHMCSDVIAAFDNLFMNKLNDGGIYIAEDLSTSYYTGCGGGYRAPSSSIEFFKTYVEIINAPHIQSVENLDARSKKIYEQMLHLNKYVKSVSFYNSICAVTKYSTPLTIQFTHISTGTKHDVWRHQPPADQIIEPTPENNLTLFDRIEIFKKSFE